VTVTDPANNRSSQPTARARVREDIRKLILTGELKPSQRLTQQQLAQRFGVAQSVVREALLELQFSGLVESIDNLGVFVRSIDNTTILHAFYVREMFEGLAARLCCHNASRADVRELQGIAERLYQVSLEGKTAQRGVLDRQFHHRQVEISGNVILNRLTDAYHVLGMVIQAFRPHDLIHSEHLAIVKAIEENRPDDAERLARQHVAGTRKAVEAQIAQGNFTPRWVLEDISLIDPLAARE
jgi:DNA-binding GntR family transcriptional regulator